MKEIEIFCEKFGLDKNAVKSLTDFIQNRVSILKEQNLLHAISDKSAFEAFVKQSVIEWNERSKEFYNRMLNPQTKKDHEDLKKLQNDVYDILRAKAEMK